MRTKDEILVIAQKRVTEENYKADAAFWIEVKKLEVLIDIRDILELRLCQIIDRIAALSKKA